MSRTLASAGIRLVAGAGAMALGLPPGSSSAEAPWSSPVTLYATDRYAWQPVLVSDPAHDLHLVFSYADSATPDATTPGALMYARLRAGHWSTPTDVLMTPGGGWAVNPALALDSSGYLHVVWLGGAPPALFHARAHVSQADLPRGWSAPTRLTFQTPSAGTFGASAAIAAGEGSLMHTVHAVTEGQLYYRRSPDGGRTWENGIALPDAGEPQTTVDHPRIAVSADGRLYVTWTHLRLPLGWPPVGSYYASSSDGGATWSEPLRVAGERYGLVNMLQVGNGPLHRAWNGIAQVPERWHQQSVDGGKNWSRPTVIARNLGGGLSGYPAMAADSLGVLHLISAAPGPSGDGIYHLSLGAGGWTAPAFISRGAVGRRSVEQPWAAVTEGNRLHVVWEDDFQRISYATRLVDAPTVAASPIPAPEPAARAASSRRTPAVLVPTASPPALTAVSGFDASPGLVGPVPALIGGAAAGITVLAAALPYLVRQARDSRAP